MAGQIIGWFFLGLLALVLLVLLVPSSVLLRYEGGVFTLKVRVLFVALRIFPARAKPSQKARKPRRAKTEKKREEEPEAEKKAEKKKTLGQKLRFYKRLAAAGWAAVKCFFRHLRIRGVELRLPVHAGQAGDTAIRCGQAQMAIGIVRALLDGRLKVKYKRLEVLPDFAGQYAGALCFSCKAVFSLGIMLVMGAVFIREYLARGKRSYSKADYLRATGRRRQDAGGKRAG